MNRIKRSLQNPAQKLLSIYFTAGYPEPQDTVSLVETLEKNGADMLEIGLPFSDPLADGPTIQESSRIALQQGMTTEKLFTQLRGIRDSVSIPLLIMGYFNPVLQFGVERFCRKCHETGIDGVIIPDLPLEEYERHYKQVFKKYDLLPVFLITPQTSDERIRAIDAASEGFIYMVSSASVTGSTGGFGTQQKEYFRRISEFGLKTPLIVGFGIKDAETFKQATRHASGAIIGSAFIKHLGQHRIEKIPSFMRKIRELKP